MPQSAIVAAMTLAPAWLLAARKEIGQREQPGNTGPVIRRYVGMAHCGTEGEPWCAIFANAMLESSGVPGTRSALARSFENHPNFAKLPGPALGAVVTFWRISPHSGFGHVGFYDGEDSHGFVNALGGNESDMVRHELLNATGGHFGLSGFYWPKRDVHGVTLPLPILGKIPVQTATTIGTGKVT